MKKFVIFVAMIAIAIATQAQCGGIKIIPTPKSFDLSADEASVTLSGSQVMVSYQLYRMDENRDYVAVGDPVEGTGKPLTWTVDKGYYRVIGSRLDQPGCSTQMNNKVTVPTENLVVSETSLPADENIVTEETSWDTLSLIPIIFLTLVIVFLSYGIWNRRKLSFGEYKELKAPFTGTVKRSKR